MRDLPLMVPTAASVSRHDSKEVGEEVLITHRNPVDLKKPTQAIREGLRFPAGLTLAPFSLAQRR